MGKDEDRISELIGLVKRNNEILSVIAKSSLADVVNKELSDKKMKELYLVTGERAVKEIAKKLKMSFGVIRAFGRNGRWWGF